MYSEHSNKQAANLILFEKIFPPTCLKRTYTFIHFQQKFLPTRLLEYLMDNGYSIRTKNQKPLKWLAVWACQSAAQTKSIYVEKNVAES